MTTLHEVMKAQNDEARAKAVARKATLALELMYHDEYAAWCQASFPCGNGHQLVNLMEDTANFEMFCHEVKLQDPS